MTSVRNGLQWKVLTGLAILTVVTVGSQIWNNSLYRTSVARYTVLGEVRQLETVGEALLGRGQHYINNAARDYESYARDVALFKRELLGDAEAFDATLKALQQRVASTSVVSDPDLAAGITALGHAWDAYRVGLAEQLGPNENEPRLEWGARFVSENQPAINTQVHALVESFQAATERDSRKAAASGIGSVLASIAVTALALWWFYFRVTQRIRATVTGCQRVASGDFGYQMPVGAGDELGQLAHAFNSLSSRTRLVLSLLDHLQRRADLAASFAELARESAPYIPTDWLALIEVSDSGNDGMVRHAVSTAERTALLNERVSLLGLFTQRDFAKATPANLRDLRRHAVEHGESRLVRELVRVGYQSALLVPLNASRDWRGLLVFAHSDPNAFADDQAKLMASLAPMLSNGLARNARTEIAEAALSVG
ncbi:MAG: HAMP domain-containing protein [Xanthomonadaceae bacterium]|nr:HAMP domain-containing protein [Xanthomonadaceae bacterium]